MSREDVEDGFWLGLLGPAGYLFHKRTKAIEQAIRDQAAPAVPAVDPATLAAADNVEVRIAAALAELQAVEAAYDELDAEIIGLEDEEARTRDAEFRKRQASIGEGALAPLAVLEKVKEWTDSLQPSSVTLPPIQSLRLALDYYVQYASALTEDSASGIWPRATADKYWAEFEKEIRKLASSSS